MSAVFALDERLGADSVPVLDLPLCAVRLMNDARYAWLLLVPRRAGLVEITDLDPAAQATLWRECALAFLEAQALASDLADLRPAVALGQGQVAPAPAASSQVKKMSASVTLLAMAASLAIAFGLGSVLPKIWTDDSQELPPAGNLSTPREFAAANQSPVKVPRTAE